MKSIFTLLIAFVIMFGLTVSAYAVLINNLDGTVTQNRVDGSSLMWLQDANYANTSGYDTFLGGRMNWFEQTHGLLH